MLVNQVHPERKKRKSQSVHEAILESARNIPGCDEDMEKMKKQLNVWVRDMRMDLKSTVDSIVVKMKTKEICGYITQGQEKVKLSSQRRLAHTFQKKG